MSRREQKLVRFDWAMKHILRDKANFNILEGFLTSLLNEKITVKNVIESEGNKNSPDEKNNRVDLKCVDSNCREMIIEIQSQYEFDYLQRILFGTSKAVVESVKIGGKYRKIPKIISINILYHALEPDENNDYIYHGKTEMKGLHSGKSLVVRQAAALPPAPCEDVFPEYYFLCVGNFKSNKKIGEKIDEWMYFFKTEAIKESFNAPGIKEAEQKFDYISMSKAERDSYDAYMDMLHYNRSSFETAVETAEHKGRTEGRTEGELKARLEVARQFLAMGLSAEQVADGTGLPVGEVKKLGGVLS